MVAGWVRTGDAAQAKTARRPPRIELPCTYPVTARISISDLDLKLNLQLPGQRKKEVNLLSPSSPAPSLMLAADLNVNLGGGHGRGVRVQYHTVRPLYTPHAPGEPISQPRE